MKPIATFSFLAMVFALPALAQQYPDKPIRFIVPYAAGGGGDIVARIIGQKLSETLGQQVVIDNRPGAGGNIGAAAAARAAPDGYTIMLGTNTHAINASLYSKSGYDLEKDFAPVMLVSSTPLVLVIHPSLPARSVRQLVALAKSRPGQLHFSTGGNGSTAHLATQLFSSMAGISLVHVPYRGTAQAITDLLSGQVQLMFPSMSSVLPQVKAGRLRALAMTGARHSLAAPDLPTVAESGLPGYEVSIWNGVLAPTGTPTEVIAKLHADILRVLNMPEVKERFAGQGVEPISSTPEECAAYIKAELARWAKVVKESGARID